MSSGDLSSGDLSGQEESIVSALKQREPLPQKGAERPDLQDCWNQIGVLGDRSCPLLNQVIHCRN